MVYVDFLVESFRIGFKGLKEYKANFYTGFFSHAFFTVVLFFFTLISIDKFAQFELSFGEVLFFTLYSQCFAMFGGFFKYGPKLDTILLSGYMNVFLARPINPFISFLFYGNLFWLVFLVIIDFFLLLIVGFWFGLFDSWLRFLICLGFSLFGALSFILIHRVFDSSAFFFKNFWFVKTPYLSMEKLYHQFPLLIFDGWLRYFGFLAGISFYGVIPVFWFFGVIDFSLLVLFFEILLGIIFICLFFIFLLWRYGLRRYEAFG